MKKILSFCFIAILSLSLISCGNKSVDVANEVKEENFHHNINKDNFQITTTRNLHNGDYLDKYVAVQGRVNTSIMDSYGNFEFEIEDGYFMPINCFWYSVDKQESWDMYQELKLNEKEGAFFDNYYNVIVYGKYQTSPKQFEYRNIFVYDIEFTEVDTSNLTAGGIPIFNNEPYSYELELENQNKESTELENEYEESNENFDFINENPPILIDEFNNLWVENRYSVTKDYSRGFIQTNDTMSSLYYSQPDNFVAMSIVADTITFDFFPVIQQTIDLFYGEDKVNISDYEGKIIKAYLDSYTGLIDLLEKDKNLGLEIEVSKPSDFPKRIIYIRLNK